MLKVAYLNVHGLSDKLQQLSPSLQNVNALFLAETWHCATNELISHPWYFSRTAITNRREGMRQKDGIAVLVNPTLKNETRVLKSTQHLLSIDIAGTVITAVYLPPSLSLNELGQTLENCAGSHVVLGDINIAFGPTFGNDTTSSEDKRNIFQRWLQQNVMTHIKPSEVSVQHWRWDHVASRLPTEMHVIPPPCPTDHPMIRINVDTRTIMPELLVDNKSYGRRFHLRRLEDTEAHQNLRETFATATSTFHNLVDLFERQLPRLSVVERSRVIDELEEGLVAAVRAAAEAALGSFSVAAQKHQPDKALEQLATSASYVSAVQSFKRACRASAPRLASSDPSLTLEEEIARHFSDTFQSPAIDAPNATRCVQHSILFDEKLKLSDDSLETFGIGDESWARIFSARAIMNMIFRYDVTKACGKDGIHTKIIRALTNGLLDQHLARLFQVCALTGITPKRWNQSIVYPLQKKAGAIHIQECRPIALTAMFRRMFEACLLKAMMKRNDCAALRKFHPTQAGFRRGHSTLLHAALSNDMASTMFKPWRTFIDFRQAYDRVPLERLLVKMRDRNAPQVVQSLALSLFSRCSLQVAANESLTEPIPTYSGLFQGSLLSPFLFLVFIDDLAEELNQGATPAVPNALLFADDLQLLGQPDQLPEMCAIVDRWCAINGMMVGIQKCGLVGRYDIHLTLQDQPVPFVQSYRYLGFPHAFSGIDFKTHVLECAEKAKKTLNFCNNVDTGWPEWMKLAIFKCFIRPRMEYGAQLIGAFINEKNESIIDLSKPKEVQDAALKWILPYSPSPLSTAGILAVPEVVTRCRALSALFALHIRYMAEDHPIHPFLAQVIGAGPWAPGLILPRAARPKLLEKHEREMDPRDKRVSVATFIKRWVIAELESRSKVACYVSRSSRVKTYGPDKTIYWKDAKTRSLALQWRVGSFGHHRLCPVPHEGERAQRGQTFRRTCIQYCLMAHPDATAQMPRRGKPKKPPDYFNIVDHVLNLQDEVEAGRCLEQLLEQFG